MCTVKGMTDPVTEYALKLALARGWNQVVFAEKISQSKQTVTMWLSRGMPPKHYGRVAKLFGISVEQLLEGDAIKGPREPAQTIYGLELTHEAASLAAEWQGLPPPWRAHVQLMVHQLLKDQARDDGQEAPVVDGPLLQRHRRV